MPDSLERLLAHLAWADQSVLGALDASPAPQPRWMELFAHVLGAEHVWLARIAGTAPKIKVWPTLGVEECREVAEENRRAFGVLGGRPPLERSRMIHYTNSAGQSFDSTMEDILLHVCLHGCYHRGQIAMGMRLDGATPVPTDYIGFIRGAPAATRQ